jgi:hypothetical protein
MNSIHRIGLAIAGLATVLVVGGALVVDGYISAQKIASEATASPTQADPTAVPLTDAPTPTPTIEPQIIYVESAPTPAIITVSKPAAPAIPAVPKAVPQATPPVIHVIVPGPTGGDDNGGGDD